MSVYTIVNLIYTLMKLAAFNILTLPTATLKLCSFYQDKSAVVACLQNNPPRTCIKDAGKVNGQINIFVIQLRWSTC